MPIPPGPETRATEVRPASASCQRFRSQRISRSRPAISGEPPSSWRGSSRGGGRASRAGSCREDRLLELAQLGAGLDPELVGERPVRGAIALHRFGLSAGAVEGEHALGVEALVGGVLSDQPVEAADRLSVSSRRELGVDRELDRAQVKLLEPADLGAGERLLGDVRERGAAPQLERSRWPRRRRFPARPRAARARRKRSKRAASTASCGSLSS